MQTVPKLDGSYSDLVGYLDSVAVIYTEIRCQTGGHCIFQDTSFLRTVTNFRIPRKVTACI
jgi:hypothetical protein